MTKSQTTLIAEAKKMIKELKLNKSQADLIMMAKRWKTVLPIGKRERASAAKLVAKGILTHHGKKLRGNINHTYIQMFKLV